MRLALLADARRPLAEELRRIDTVIAELRQLLEAQITEGVEEPVEE